MADTKNPGDKPLSVGTKTLSLKPRTETGVVRQSFSHGRTKPVVVEKKTKRRLASDPAPAAEAPAPKPAAPAQAAPANPVCAADCSDECGGNRDDAARRFRTNQPHHWKHVVVGLH